MKVIDLLNKIAKGEKVPRKFIVDGDILCIEKGKCLEYENGERVKWFIYSCWLNEEVELIEDNNKIEKIKTTDDKYIFNTITNSYNQPTSWGYFLANKINEIIDKIEKLDNEKTETHKKGVR